ncbi:hypothetical protein OG352_19160 [Streptomyces sp. NBC_01485]|uniref:hypothetical protein n=1 Tax=Streptomyces sp. NBC_01485 TaxID=2903884 RepID=UPI002E31ED00|nr:hypothetical protein [Streptomyces sp. NBC_01485]
MRIRALALAASGAVALSAFAVPAAQAAPAAPVGPAVTFSKVKVNAGKNIVVGTTGKLTVTATYTVTKPASLSASSFQSGPAFYRGTTLDLEGNSFGGDNPGTCTTVSSTVLNCTAKVEFRPASSDDTEDLTNADAGTWKLGALAVGSNGGITTQTGFGTSNVQRQAQLTVNAAPEPVKKGKTITVTGKLSRANWDTSKYAGYAAQPVQLQFKKNGSTTYTTVKTVKTSSTGGLSTTVKAGVDGSYRYTFAGTTTTPAVSAAGDFVDVK